MNRTYVYLKYEDSYNPRTFVGRAYSYYTSLKLTEGDIVEAPTRFGMSIARVSKINVPEEMVKNIIPFMKEITKKINKERYLNYDEILEEVA